MASKISSPEPGKYDNKSLLEAIMHDKHKQELVEIIFEMIDKAPHLKNSIALNPEDIQKAIKNSCGYYYMHISGIANRLNEMCDLIMEHDDKINNLMLLFEKSLQDWRGTAMDEYDEPIYKILETLLLEIKKLPKNQQQILVNKVMDLINRYEYPFDLENY